MEVLEGGPVVDQLVKNYRNEKKHLSKTEATWAAVWGTLIGVEVAFGLFPSVLASAAFPLLGMSLVRDRINNERFEAALNRLKPRQPSDNF